MEYGRGQGRVKKELKSSERTETEYIKRGKRRRRRQQEGAAGSQKRYAGTQCGRQAEGGVAAAAAAITAARKQRDGGDGGDGGDIQRTSTSTKRKAGKMPKLFGWSHTNTHTHTYSNTYIYIQHQHNGRI